MPALAQVILLERTDVPYPNLERYYLLGLTIHGYLLVGTLDKREGRRPEVVWNAVVEEGP